MSIRYTRARLETDDEVLEVLLPGFVSSVKETKQDWAVRNFLQENISDFDVTLTLRHYLFGDESPAYDADVNHLLLLAATDEMRNARQLRPVDDLDEQQVRQVKFILEQEAT